MDSHMARPVAEIQPKQNACGCVNTPQISTLHNFPILY